MHNCFPRNLKLIGEDLKSERKKQVFHGQLSNFLIMPFLKVSKTLFLSSSTLKGQIARTFSQHLGCVQTNNAETFQNGEQETFRKIFFFFWIVLGIWNSSCLI